MALLLTSTKHAATVAAATTALLVAGVALAAPASARSGPPRRCIAASTTDRVPWRYKVAIVAAVPSGDLLYTERRSAEQVWPTQIVGYCTRY